MKTLLPEINSTDKRFHAGNPATGEQGTRVTDTWLNDVQDRVRDVQAEAHYVLQKAGFTPKAETQTQLYQAIVKIIDDNRKKASTTQKGEVQLYSGYDSDSEELAATPKVIKTLKGFIDSITRSLTNYIPNSKKSSRVDSNSSDTIADSKAVKIAYDKAMEAKNAADAAQQTANDGVSKANASNDNANGRVSKSGDTMIGALAITGSNSGGFANGLMLKNKADGKGTSGFVDFYQTDNAPRASLWFRDTGNGSCDVEILTSPEGSNINEDKRNLHTKFNPDGSLWVKKYGLLHDYFMTRGDFSSSWYPNHYAGTEVYKIRHLGLMITVMNLGTGNAEEYYLPEAYNGHALAWVTDNGGARGVGVSSVYDGNKIRLHGGNTISRSVLVIGRKNW